MANIRAFRAIRPIDGGMAAEVAALPYDVMNADEARAMTGGKPHSFLHVDKAEIDLSADLDPYDDAVYEKAGDSLRKMLLDGVLIQDDLPRMYIYRLTESGGALERHSQTGLVACASVDEYENGVIRKHELTREDKERDRIRHIEACNAHTGPIFLAYRRSGEIDSVIGGWIGSHEPVYDFVSEDGIRHEAWAIDDEAVISSLHEFFGQIPRLYIADGHHRNAAAAKVALKRREQGCGSQDELEHEFNFYLSVLFPSNQLRILDYNRLVKDLNGLSYEDFMEKVRERFDVSEGGSKPQKQNQFCMYISHKWFTLDIRREFLDSTLIGALDVSLLQNVLLAPVLGILNPRTDKRIDFVGGIRGVEELARRVDSGNMAVAFALYPVSMDELMAIADADMIMPPKSTWFEPKLRSGLFIHSLD